MKVDIFDFDLPKELIASQPVTPRHASRLLDLSSEGSIVDRHFSDLPDLLEKGDVLVCNDTKVIPARLYGRRGGALVEVTLYHPVDGLTWWSFVKNAKRLKPQDVISFYNDEISAEESDFSAEVLEKNSEDGVLLKFNCNEDKLPDLLQKFGFQLSGYLQSHLMIYWQTDFHRKHRLRLSDCSRLSERNNSELYQI